MTGVAFPSDGGPAMATVSEPPQWADSDAAPGRTAGGDDDGIPVVTRSRQPHHEATASVPAIAPSATQIDDECAKSDGIPVETRRRPDLAALPSTPIAAEEPATDQTGAPETTDIEDASASSSGAAPDPVAEAVQLSSEQTAVLNLVKSGRSVFFTGAAGTGKSFLLKEIIKALPRATTFVTALTGIAAVPLGGTTLHSFAGIGLGTEQVHELLPKIRRSQKAAKNWVRCRTLIIDEVSMLDSDLFDKLEQIAANIRHNRRPFGGIQLVLVGDFFQLPPCEKGSNVSYCFEAKSWNSCVPHVIELTQIFRQKESKLIDMLNEIRLGQPSAQTTAALKELYRPLPSDAGIQPTKLYSRNHHVDAENERCLNSINAVNYPFTATDTGKEPYLSQLDKYFLAVPKLTLKVGAQVMIIKNMEDLGVVNGTRGVVVDFRLKGKGTERLPVVRLQGGREIIIDRADFSVVDHGGEVLANRRMIPLKLAWAISIHKSQGMSIDYLEVRLDDCFAEGQAYVALSRARTLSGLRVLAFNPACCRTNPKVIEFHRTMREQQPNIEEILAEDLDQPDMWEEGDAGAAGNGSSLQPLNAYDAQAYSRQGGGRQPRKPRPPRQPRKPRHRDNGGWKSKPGTGGAARSHPYGSGAKSGSAAGGARQSSLTDSKWNMFM